MEVAENINEIKEIINSNKGYIYLNWGDRRFNNEITNYISQVKGLVEKVSNIPGVNMRNNFASMDISEFKKWFLLGIGTSRIDPSKLDKEQKDQLLKIITESITIKNKFFSFLFTFYHRPCGRMQSKPR